MFDVICRYERPSEALIERFKEIEASASILESIPGKTGALDSRIKPIWPEAKACGPALTVQCPAGDNLMLHKAIDMALPGDILLVTTEGYEAAGGMFGGIMATCCMVKGVGGLIFEGCCRDSVEIRRLGLPVYATGLSVKATTKSLPGKINHPMVIGNVLVHPGDIVFCDSDGIVVVPLQIAEEVAKRALDREVREAALQKRILEGAGTTFTLGGFDKTFEALGITRQS